MRSYETARKIFSALEILSWCVVAGGIILALVGASEAPRGSEFLLSMPGILLSAFGVIAVAMVQTGRATVDSAEYGQQALKVARDQLEISRQSLKLQQGAPTSGFGDAGVRPSETKATSDTWQNSFADRVASYDRSSENDQLDWDYRGKRIHRTENGFLLEGQTFVTLDAAKEHVDVEIASSGLPAKRLET